ncbi:hypothetical protein I7I53_01701 [Histoplasma capsulatum var. duboisii H88]|uniref:Uncharacterized protein n=1 Tax=Ajellomyces capsulatus (strain H88) TaxID=544711 RepID=A0A8A1LMC1_AJEC8|nr:hypothetical protein I7I53_01701 [Histoplasma capsulatum var. duboisii H88]
MNIKTFVDPDTVFQGEKLLPPSVLHCVSIYQQGSVGICFQSGNFLCRAHWSETCAEILYCELVRRLIPASSDESVGGAGSPVGME